MVAQRVYGATKRPFGYAYGGSGGAFRSIGSFENTTGVWDGVVPYVMGSNLAIPNMFTWRMRALRVLGPKLDGVVDAADPGGSGRNGRPNGNGVYSAGQLSRISTKRVSQALVWWPSTTRWSMVNVT